MALLLPSTWPTATSAMTSSSQPKIAVFLCRALHPAMRSTTGRRPGGSAAMGLGTVFWYGELWAWRMTRTSYLGDPCYGRAGLRKGRITEGPDYGRAESRTGIAATRAPAASSSEPGRWAASAIRAKLSTSQETRARRQLRDRQLLTRSRTGVR